MRLGLAAKLCLLAAALVFGTTRAASYLFFNSARDLVRERGLADLRDEVELRRQELLADLDRAQADLLHLAASPEVRALLAPAGEPRAAERARLEKSATQLFTARPVYRQFALVRADAEGHEVLRVDHPADADPHATPDADLRPWRDRPDFKRAGRLGPTVTWYSDVRPAGPALEQVVATPVAGADGKPAGFAFLRYDFGALARRINQSPRLLGFLVNAHGDYLAHPDPARILGAAGDAGERGPLEQAFDELTEASRTGQPTLGVRRDELPLPGLGFFLATPRFPPDTGPDRLQQVRGELHRKYPDVRIGRPGEITGRLTVRAATADQLRPVMADFGPALGGRVSWDEPYRCATFALWLLPLRPQARGRADAAVEEVAPWFGLGVAIPYEEIEHDIAADFRRNAWVSLGLSVLAAAGMLLFALYLTRPLRRMTGFAERVAAGQEADLDLPQHPAKDEIGTLARAFARMVEQIRLRTRELRESEARIRIILNTAAEGIATIDEQGRLESFNLAAERIFGYPVDEVRGQHFRKLLQRGAPADMPTLLNTAAAPGFGGESSLMNISRVNGTTREVLARRKDGQAFPVEMAVSEVVLGDRLVYTAILRDITERKQAEAQIQHMTEGLEHRVAERTAELMQANQALEAARDLALEANRAKDAFLAVMSHELRTPLNAIIGYCDYWLHEADEHNPQEMLDDLRKMHVSGKHLLALINDILDLAKIQAGKVVLELSDFDLPPLLSELEEWVEPLVRKNGNTLTVEAATDLGTMRADRTRVRQILLNLLSNAAKFTTAGSIRLQVLRQSAGGREEIVFRVSDTGVGMTAEDIQRLFQPFVQVGSSGQRKQEGTGLGLAICRRLCEMMGGSIEVQSAPGAGATFTVRLPARVAPPELPVGRPGVPEAAPPATEPATVLVVDNDPAVRELLERVLTKEGYRVRAAPGGAAGLAMARRERPAAVVLDALMPGGIDGWSVLAALKSDPATADIPVILATIVDGRTRGFALAASDYVTKPIDWDRLGVILRRHRAAAPDAPVLLIDDDEPMREVTARHLRAQGWEVIEAADGRQGLEQMRERRPAVILLDLMMPNMNGFEFVDALRREPAGQTVPVVVVTAADLSVADRARLSGRVQQVLQKGSVTPEELMAEVRAQVRQCVVRRPGE